MDNLSDLPDPCRSCTFWELDPAAAVQAEVTDAALEKEAWVSDTLLQWGTCGKLAYVDAVPAGYLIFAPPGYVPRSLSFPTSPVGADALLLIAARVRPEFLGGGLGRMLVHALAGEAARRGVRAVEAFGRLGSASGDPLEPASCLLPASFLLAVGFKTVRPHHRYPRLRLDIRSTASWREDVEAALERLLGTATSPLPVGG